MPALTKTARVSRHLSRWNPTSESRSRFRIEILFSVAGRRRKLAAQGRVLEPVKNVWNRPRSRGRKTVSRPNCRLHYHLWSCGRRRPNNAAQAVERYCEAVCCSEEARSCAREELQMRFGCRHGSPCHWRGLFRFGYRRCVRLTPHSRGYSSLRSDVPWGRKQSKNPCS